MEKIPGKSDAAPETNEDVESFVAIAGHPLHAMSIHFPIALVICTLAADGVYWWGGDPFWARVGLWSAGLAFVMGSLAGVIGIAELLLVRGIRGRVASWSHGVVAMTLIAVMALNWGVRWSGPEAVLPHGLLLSVLATVLTGFAGWYGGKLVFDHGIGLMVSSKD